jgi:hypothetical protein
MSQDNPMMIRFFEDKNDIEHDHDRMWPDSGLQHLGLMCHKS